MYRRMCKNLELDESTWVPREIQWFINKQKDVAPAVQRLKGTKVLGFDTETRPSFKSGEAYPPALLQLASDREVCIFQLHQIEFPNALNRLLANPDILKVGVAIGYDVLKLLEVMKFCPSGFVELGEMASKLGIKNLGVRSLTALLFGFRLSKHARCSMWDTKKLSDIQINYAATDAWASREIYMKLYELTHRK